MVGVKRCALKQIPVQVIAVRELTFVRSSGLAGPNLGEALRWDMS